MEDSVKAKRLVTKSNRSVPFGVGFFYATYIMVQLKSYGTSVIIRT